MTKAEQARLVGWRLKILQRAGDGPRRVAQTCRQFGISRKTFYKWKHRHAAHGPAGVGDRAPPAAPIAAGHVG
jgi:transposase-like protein